MSERVSTTTMLPCPFCGAPARHPHKHVRNRQKFAACSRHGCILHGPLHSEETTWYAIEAWNRRAAIAAHDAAQPGGEVGGEPVAWRCHIVSRGSMPARIEGWIDGVPTQGQIAVAASEGWRIEYAYPTDKRAQDCKRALEGLSQDALDGGWCFAGMEKYCKGLESKITELTTPPPASQPAKQGEGDDLAARFSEVHSLETELNREVYEVLSRRNVRTAGCSALPTAHTIDFASHPAQATIKEGGAQAVAGEVDAEVRTIQAMGRAIEANIAHNEPITQVAELTAAYPALIRKIAALTAEIARLRERYQWLANRVLACDHGDNDAPGEKIGWRIRFDLLTKDGKRQPAFMFGQSIDAAIDTAIRASRGEGL